MSANERPRDGRTAIGRLNDVARPRLEGRFVVYTHEGLAATLRVAPAELEHQIAAAAIKAEQKNGSWFIPRTESRAFFSQFLRLPAEIPSAHVIPSYLRRLDLPWARTLLSMYEDPLNYPAALPPNQGEFLRALVLNLAPEHIFEIGCYTGISTLWMASALEELGGQRTITAVDLFDDICPTPPHRYESLEQPIEYVRSSLAAAALQHRVTLVQANSHELGARYGEKIGRTIDLLYIDGDHSVSGALKDFYLYAPHVKIGGYIVLHDIHPQHSSYRGPRFILEAFVRHSTVYEMVEINTTPLNFGIAVMRKRANGGPSSFSVRLAEIARDAKRKVAEWRASSKAPA